MLLIRLLPAALAADPRNIDTGTVMLRSGYLDQPYCAVLTSGRWVCTITGSSGKEGSSGEHVQSIWSDDAGDTWGCPVPVEPAPVGTELANAYSMTLAAPGLGPNGTDRVYTVYNMNTQNVTHFPDGRRVARTDMLGVFWMRYSDDGGETWSGDRYRVPFRLTPIDYGNDWNGTVTIMWTVDVLKVRGGVAYFAFTKIGQYVLGPPEEMWVLASDNILHAADAADVRWKLLPDGDHGLRPQPGEEGTHLEEAHVVPMTGAGHPGFYAVGRTTTGWLAASQTASATAEGGWATTGRAQYWDPSASPKAMRPLNESATAFGGPHAGLKNPRGPVQMKRVDGASASPPGAGAYLLLFYNNNAKTYLNRNPYWLSAGYEVADGGGGGPAILWSQPEIALFSTDHENTRPGYPDFIEHGADVYITETQKDTARLHKVDAGLLRGLFHQRTMSRRPDLPAAVVAPPKTSVPTPPYPSFNATGGVGGPGLAAMLTVRNHTLASPGDVLLDSRAGGAGVAVTVGDGLSMVLWIGDGVSSFNLSTDAACTAVLSEPGAHVFAANADAGASLATLMVDGVLCDGAGTRDYGWTWMPPLAGVGGAAATAVAPKYGGELTSALLYTRTLTTSEMVGGCRFSLSE